MSKFESIVERMNEIAVLQRAKAVLYWDQVMDLPHKGGSYRAKQLSTLTKLVKEKLDNESLWGLVNEICEDPKGLSNLDREDVFALRKELKKKRAVPTKLAVQLTEAESLGERTWEQAKKTGDVKAFVSILRPLFNLRKEECAYTHPELSPCDASIENHNPGLSSTDLDPLFEELKKGLTSLLSELDLSKNEKVQHLLKATYPVSRQKIICDQLVEDLGFSPDLRAVRESSHPFSITLGPQDFRITTRYDKHKMFDSFLSLAHEMGHSLYDEGIHSEAFHGMPRSNSQNLAVHESHSLFWENRVICSKPMLEKYYHQFKSSFPESIGNIDIEDFHLLTRGVKPSFIRVEADELTYCLHIILRYTIEKALFNDEIRVEELNDYWNHCFEELFGIKPLRPQDGCMQDIHWAGGAFGYFPSYALGHLISAQMSSCLEKDLKVQLEENHPDLVKIKAWLSEKCYSLPAYLDVIQYVKEVTGAPLSVQPFVNYLRKKYTNFYG